MPRRFNALAKAGGRRRPRRRTNVVAKAKYLPKTARANRALIKSNALMLRQLKKQLPEPVFCDFQQLNSIQCEPSTVANPRTFTTNGRALTNFPDWQPCLRQSAVAIRKSSTRVYRMQMNIRYTLRSSYWAQCSLFIVTIRKDANIQDPTGTNILASNTDFITNQIGTGFDPGYFQNIRLNSARYKVHYARHVTLTQGSYTLPPVEDQTSLIPFAGNPMTTYKKGQVNLKMRMNVRVPATSLAWPNLTIEQLPYYQRYYLLTAVTQQAEPGTTPDASVIIDTDLLACTVNYG